MNNLFYPTPWTRDAHYLIVLNNSSYWGDDVDQITSHIVDKIIKENDMRKADLAKEVIKLRSEENLGVGWRWKIFSFFLSFFLSIPLYVS